MAIALGIAQREDFGSIYARTYDSVYRHCRRLCRSREDAEDVAQEAYIRAYAAYDCFRSDRPVENWLLRIATNAFLDMRRRTLRRPVTVSQSILHKGQSIDNLVDTRPGPDAFVEQEHERDVLHRAIDSLQGETKALARAAFIDLQPHSALTKRYALNKCTLRSKLFRARKAIRKNCSLN